MAFLMKFKSFFYSLSDVDCMQKKKSRRSFRFTDTSQWRSRWWLFIDESSRTLMDSIFGSIGLPRKRICNYSLDSYTLMPFACSSYETNHLKRKRIASFVEAFSQPEVFNSSRDPAQNNLRRILCCWLKWNIRFVSLFASVNFNIVNNYL